VKLIIAGSRTITEYAEVEAAIAASGFTPTEIVSGGASGVDTLGEIWALRHNIPIKHFPARWKEYGRSAGMIRNEQMGRYADALVAAWDGKSRGTRHMIYYMTHHLKKPVSVYRPEVGSPTHASVCKEDTNDPNHNL
jgi:hypothetical protein